MLDVFKQVYADGVAAAEQSYADKVATIAPQVGSLLCQFGLLNRHTLERTVGVEILGLVYNMEATVTLPVHEHPIQKDNLTITAVNNDGLPLIDSRYFSLRGS